jgi:protein deglycase
MKYCIFLGNNFEDVEAVTQIDILARAGVKVDIYGVGSDTIKSRSNIVYKTDRVFIKAADVSISEYDGILLPGGPGVKELINNEALIQVIRDFHGAKKLVFAICAAPRLLDRAGILKGRKYTGYPGEEIHDGTRVDERVVIDGNIITSQGVGTSLDAALKLVEIIVSNEEANKQAGKVLYSSCL